MRALKIALQVQPVVPQFEVSELGVVQPLEDGIVKRTLWVAQRRGTSRSG